MLSPSPSLSLPSQTRAIVLLAVAGFAGQAMVRSADSLLPQIAADFAVTIGAASIVVSAYSLMHGSMQFVIGPIGDRFGKYRMIAIMWVGANCYQDIGAGVWGGVQISAVIPMRFPLIARSHHQLLRKITAIVERRR